MNIQIENFPPGVTEGDVMEFLGGGDDIERVLLTDAGNSDDVVAVVKVKTGHTGAAAMAEFIHGRFYRERRLSARAMTLLND